MHILFVDDSEDARRLFGLAFRIARHTVHLAGNGAEAVKAVEEEVFSAILLDLHMPIMNGWEALPRIRELPNGKRACIAIMSAVYEHVDMQRAIAQGADAVFAKPPAPSVILVKLEEMVAKSGDG